MKKKSIVALIARQHGLSGLKSLLAEPNLEVIAIVTHRRLPKSEDADRSERSDFGAYLAVANEHGIPLITVDSKEDQLQLEKKLLQLRYDYLISISWRRLIPLSMLQQATIGCINLHRGRLPDYPGAEPIKQALQKGDRTISITAHVLDEQIDHGPILCTYEHPVAYQMNRPLDDNIERLKQELTPHFGPLLLKAIQQMS